MPNVPEIEAYIEQMTHSGPSLSLPQNQRIIYALMAALDRFWFFYRHEGPELQEIIRRIASDEYREGLRDWYRGKDEMNPRACSFKSELERITGEVFGD